MNFIKSFAGTLFNQTLNSNGNFQQIRTKWVNRWMIRDVKRRKVTTEYAPLRLRINSLRRNDILPPEIKELADAQIEALPRDSALMRTTKRCVITSRPRGVVYRWRMSRIVFRNLADYNKLCGVQRAMW
ncbi:mitochondrial ribosomal protein S14 [Leptinotarsa decemlineata]|uniref:mitochondrial ribosomal protein S14 n=1 Tax=Leptinotarsa decemlineata TaxID=7539 RepID=UPI000C2526FD|nr:28S ribosomal protein S14, mitochondrial [Leptinotarsa decemlineata]